MLPSSYKLLRFQKLTSTGLKKDGLTSPFQLQVHYPQTSAGEKQTPWCNQPEATKINLTKKKKKPIKIRKENNLIFLSNSPQSICAMGMYKNDNASN